MRSAHVNVGVALWLGWLSLTSSAMMSALLERRDQLVVEEGGGTDDWTVQSGYGNRFEV